MQPTPAEVARTLASGYLPGTAQVACGPGPLPARHATDCAGRLLLLTEVGDPLDRMLRCPDGPDVATVLRVDDAPPLAGAPHRGRVWISGWSTALSGESGRAAALEFAESNPCADLLDVGRGHALHRVEVAEVRLERADGMIEVDLDEYVLAEPDPLRVEERDLLIDLAAHHGAQIGAWVRRQVTGSGLDPGATAPRVVRLDRYGLVAVLGPEQARYQARLSFPAPLRDRADLARLLHPVLCLRCNPAGGCRGGRD